MISCRNKLFDIKLQLYKENRLVQINQRVALLKIKKYWRDHNLTSKKIITKLKRVKKFKPRLSRIKSLDKNVIISLHAFTYSMINLPIIYNENILLGSHPAPNPSISKNKVTKKTVATSPIPPEKNTKYEREREREREQGKGKEKEKEKGKLRENRIKRTELPQASNSAAPIKLPTLTSAKSSAVKIEKIIYPSPFAERLGFRSFNFKVWKPISHNYRFGQSLTPNPRNNSLISRGTMLSRSNFLRNRLPTAQKNNIC